MQRLVKWSGNSARWTALGALMIVGRRQLVVNMATTVVAITAAAIQPNRRRRGPITLTPMVGAREASNIITTMIGTAMTPFNDQALQLQVFNTHKSEAITALFERTRNGYKLYATVTQTPSYEFANRDNTRPRRLASPAPAGASHARRYV
jgi:hypothetical protein